MTIGLARANHGLLAFAALAAAAPAFGQRPDPIGTEHRSVIGTAAARVAPAVVSVNVVRRERTLPRTMFEMFALPRGAQGRVRRGWIGVEIAEPPPRSGSWRRQPGVPVRRVATGGPGDRAGLKPGDIIDRVNGQLIRNFLNWEKALLDLGIGDTLHVTVRRGDVAQDVDVPAIELPSESATRITFSDLALVTVTPAIQAERHLASPRGALVVTAGPESQRTLGLQSGDVILQVNNVPVTSAEQFNEVIAYYRGRGAMRLFFEREGQIGYADFWGGR